MKKPRKKHWSLMVEERGVRVRVYERPGTENLTREVRMPDGTKDRRSLGHGDRTLAEQQVRALARELARAELTGADLGALSIGQLFAAYFHPRHGKLLDRAAWKQAARTRADLFMEAWGPDLPVRDLSQGHVDRYAAARRAGTLSPLGDGGRGDRTPVRVRDGTIDGDFRWLSSAFNWARRHKVDGRRLLSENPLHDLRWPKEANVRRPVASHERFLRTRKVVDRVDPQGRLRCILALARYTGRREAAICGLRASDLLLSVGRVQEALAAAGMDERIGEHMPHGAIRWAAESDKQGLLHITPISRRHGRSSTATSWPTPWSGMSPSSPPRRTRLCPFAGTQSRPGS